MKPFTLNLNIIQKCYPDSIILDINEMYFPYVGWIKTEGFITPYNSIEEIERRIKLRIFEGATHFNFKIKDEFEQIRYPDYNTKEIITFI